MPCVTIKTGVVGADGHEVILSDYLCDWPGCANMAEHVVGIALELASACVMCREHYVMFQNGASPPPD